MVLGRNQRRYLPSFESPCWITSLLVLYSAVDKPAESREMSQARTGKTMGGLVAKDAFPEPALIHVNEHFHGFPWGSLSTASSEMVFGLRSSGVSSCLLPMTYLCISTRGLGEAEYKQ